MLDYIFSIFSNQKTGMAKVKKKLIYILVISFLYQCALNNRLHHFDNPNFAQQLYNRFFKDNVILLIFQINLILFFK